MQTLSHRISEKKSFIVASLLYAFTAILLFPFLRWYVDNPDTISYITIAKKYSHADFAAAVNGYFSPLITWLLSVLLKLDRDPIITFKVLQIFIGWFALVYWTDIVLKFIRQKFFQRFLIVSVIPFLISYAFLNLTADLLFLSMVLFYLDIVSEKEFFNHRHFGIISGIIGALMYFSKSFGLSFFLLHFSVLFLRNFFTTKEFPFRKHLTRNYLQMIFCFTFISFWWIYLLTDKYQHFAISENVSFNLSREVAVRPEQKVELPILSAGLNKPVNTTALNAWEDPGFVTKVTPLHPLSSSDDLSLYKQIARRNLLTIYYFDFRRQLGFIFLILFIAFLFSGHRRRLFSDDHFFSLTLTIILVYIGYALILVHTRYVWICSLLMLLLSGWMIEDLFSKNKMYNVTGRILFILLILLAVKRPVKEILFSEDKEVSAITFFNSMFHPVEAMKATYLPDNTFFEASEEFRAKIPVGKNIASIKTLWSNRNQYTQASLIALKINANYFGQIAEEDSTMEIQLDKFDIENVVIFSEDKNLLDTSSGWQIIYEKKNLPMKIYKRELK